MNSPQDPRKDPLQDDEVALARVLRALPGGEPPPRVDAAILAAARNASAASPSRAHRRRGLPGWALGTAAAAVLAVGIGLQLQPARDALPDGVTAEAPTAASATDVELQQVEVTGSRLKRAETEEADFAAPQAKPRSPTPEPVPPAPATPVMPPPPAPPAPPAPARPVAAEALRQAEAAAAQSLADEVQSLESSAQAERARAAASQSEARRAPVPVAESPPVQEAADAAGAAAPSAFSADDVLPPVDEDARLDADDWLERIRDRIRQGDRAGAGASLQRFQRAHPDVPLPPDLAAFRP